MAESWLGFGKSTGVQTLLVWTLIRVYISNTEGIVSPLMGGANTTHLLYPPIIFEAIHT